MKGVRAIVYNHCFDNEYKTCGGLIFHVAPLPKVFNKILLFECCVSAMRESLSVYMKLSNDASFKMDCPTVPIYVLYYIIT